MTKDKILHVVVAIAIATLASALEANTGCSYFSAALAGVMAAVAASLAKEWADVIYQERDTMTMFNSDLFFGCVGALIGASVGACVTLMI